MIRQACAIGAALLITGCGDAPQTDGGNPSSRPIRIAVAPDSGEAPMPGKIDPPEGKWMEREDEAAVDYGAPDTGILLRLACRNGIVTATRPVASDNRAKAMLAFVGYRGILRLPVENDGKVWTGKLNADDPRWIAVTGGPFYATVAGGGKVISPASSKAAAVINNCRTTEKPGSGKTLT